MALRPSQRRRLAWWQVAVVVGFYAMAVAALGGDLFTPILFTLVVAAGVDDIGVALSRAPAKKRARGGVGSRPKARIPRKGTPIILRGGR